MIRKFFEDVQELLTRLDGTVNRAQIHWPRVFRVSEDLSVVKRLFSRLFKLAVILVVIAVIYWVIARFFIGPAPESTDPALQYVQPTLEPSPTAITDLNPWDKLEWLSAQDARGLRVTQNMVNLVYLDAGQAIYSKNYSITLDKSWNKAKPLGMTSMSLTGTAVKAEINGQTYNFNAYEPFVIAGLPDKVFIVDLKGTTWSQDTSEIKLSLLTDVVRTLPITISPNPNLTFTY